MGSAEGIVILILVHQHQSVSRLCGLIAGVPGGFELGPGFVLAAQAHQVQAERGAGFLQLRVELQAPGDTCAIPSS